MEDATLSVLITAFNREKFIGEAIESVLASSYSDYELIIVDDCSSDNTVAIIKGYAEKDARIKWYINESNVGQFANRNKAAKYASGKYIKYVDSDDVIYPYSLQIMMDAMAKFPESGLGFCVKYKDGEMPYPYLLNPSESFLIHYLKSELLLMGPSGLIIKRDVFEKVNGFEEYGMPSDNHLTLKIAGKYPVVALQRDLFWWRLHSNQVFSINVNNHQNILNNYLFNSDILVNYSPLTKEENKLILKKQKQIFYMNLIRLFWKKARPGVAISLLREYSKIKKI